MKVSITKAGQNVFSHYLTLFLDKREAELMLKPGTRRQATVRGDVASQIRITRDDYGLYKINTPSKGTPYIRVPVTDFGAMNQSIYQEGVMSEIVGSSIVVSDFPDHFLSKASRFNRMRMKDKTKFSEKEKVKEEEVAEASTGTVRIVPRKHLSVQDVVEMTQMYIDDANKVLADDKFKDAIKSLEQLAEEAKKTGLNLALSLEGNQITATIEGQ